MSAETDRIVGNRVRPNFALAAGTPAAALAQRGCLGPSSCHTAWGRVSRRGAEAQRRSEFEPAVRESNEQD